MKVFDSLEHITKGQNIVATIGTFDGVHLGHKKILQRIKDLAAETGGESVLISFHPHPRLVLFPEKQDLKLLQTLTEKIETLRDFGLDTLILIPFTKEFSTTPSLDFIQKILVEAIGIQRLVIGYDHHFGKNRSGDIHELRQLAPMFGYEVEEIPAQAIDNANVSSTKIRAALLSGDVVTANTFLGYPYRFTGEVIHGEKQGRLLGYPTANLKVNDPTKLIPADGIYFVSVIYNKKTFYGMMSIGKKPTMGEFERGIEVNIFDFEENIYGENLTIELLSYIRPEAKFDSLESLIQAIDGDKEFCMREIEKMKKPA
ncbi:MAG: bifunctional riboflavin kinase/FAD synthetase [Bacteroidia bacterium]